MTVARHVVVFARAPVLGRVKRRLGRDIGAVAATRFHRAMIARLTRTLGGDGRWRLWLAVTPDAALDRHPWPAGAPRFAQGDGDLGVRMARALRRLPPGPAVIVGSDIPGIRPAHVAAAFDMLGRREAVFGPGEDGGYWLVGWRRHRPLPAGALAGVRWSTRHALADSERSLGRAGIGRIATLPDIDDGAAWRRWRGLDGPHNEGGDE